MASVQHELLSAVYGALCVLTRGRNFICFWPGTGKNDNERTTDKRIEWMLAQAKQTQKPHVIALTAKEHGDFLGRRSNVLRLHMFTLMPFVSSQEQRTCLAEVEKAFRAAGLEIKWDGNPVNLVEVRFG